MQYDMRTFGNDEKAIELILLDSALDHGLIGMLTSPRFTSNIALVIESKAANERDYDFPVFP